MPYTNAKVIYRIFREEKRIISYTKNLTRNPALKEDYLLLQNYEMLREDASIKLAKALTTDLLTEPQRAKIYQQNFDEFVGNPSLNLLEGYGNEFLGIKTSQIGNKNTVVLPVPMKTNNDKRNHSDADLTELFEGKKDEHETMKEFIFPLR